MATNAPFAGSASKADRMRYFLLLQVPVVEDHPHRDHVNLGQRVLEEISGRRRGTIGKPGRGDVLLGYRLNGREVERGARQVRMLLRHEDRE